MNLLSVSTGLTVLDPIQWNRELRDVGVWLLSLGVIFPRLVCAAARDGPPFLFRMLTVQI